MRFVVLMDNGEVAMEIDLDTVKAMVIAACKSGATPGDALDLVKEELKRRLVRT